jgi:LuxR family maltose regulon positive regulatory protein
MQKTDILIRTKLRQPFIRPNLVPRPRLQEQITVGLQAPLTLVIAPAGFGKTTLVAASIASSRMQIAWLSLDQNDNQAGRFLTYLIAALQGVDHHIGGEAAQLIAGMQPAPPEAVLTSLVNDLDAAGGEMVLVLDDYQYINSPEVHAAVGFFLEHCPHSFHLLIATRSDPPLPLARLRARGQMVELRTADLRFSDPEAAQFLNDVMGLGLDIGSVAMLEGRTEGWVAGLQMAALSMRDHEHIRGFIEGFSGTNRHILDYLLEEVLAGQPPEIQRFLLYTSIVERLTAPLGDALLESGETSGVDADPGGALTGASSAQSSFAILEYLERENLFLVSLDDERTWFRYHHLFADLLRARLHQAQPDLVHRLHLRASEWLEQNGYISEAIQHLLADHAQGQAADLIERYGPARWGENDISVIQMADSLPPEILGSRPRLGLHQVWLLISQGHIERAITILKDLAQHLAQPETAYRPHWMQSMVALALAFLSGSNPLPDFRELDEIPADEPVLGDAAEILYGMALGRRGELDRAAEVSAQILQKKKKPSQRTPAIRSLATFLARIYLMQGRIHAAASLCHKYLDPLPEKDRRFVNDAAMMNGILGEVLYEWNVLDLAEQHIRDALQANEIWRNILTEAWGLLALTRVLVAKGDSAEAIQVVAKFETRLAAQTRPFEFSDDLRTLRARVQLASGDTQNAFQWANQLQQNEDYLRHEELYRLTLAHTRLVQGRYAEVEKMLTGPVLHVGGGNRVTREIETIMILAAAIAAQQRLPEAIRLVDSCLDLAEPEGYIRSFVDLGEPARGLLAAYLADPSCEHKEYARKILAAFGMPVEQAPRGLGQAGMLEALTPRELDVLRLLAQGCANRQIAEKLFLSEGTVKFYMHAVMDKLGVHSRTQAILIARERNLV